MRLALATPRLHIAAPPQNPIPPDVKSQAATQQFAPIGQGAPNRQGAQCHEPQSLARMRFVLRRVLLLALALASMAVWVSAPPPAPPDPVETYNLPPPS